MPVSSLLRLKFLFSLCLLTTCSKGLLACFSILFLVILYSFQMGMYYNYRAAHTVYNHLLQRFSTFFHVRTP
jgi:hypothetical protein